MLVYLMFSPTRTRNYTRSPFDFDHDFFVKFTKLEAVCATLEATGPVGQRIMEALRDDCSLWGELPYSITNDFGIWRDYMPTAWNDAVGMQTAQLMMEGDEPPDSVFVVLGNMERRIWGGQAHKHLEVLRVFSTREAAEVKMGKDPTVSVVEMPLVGVPVRT